MACFIFALTVEQVVTVKMCYEIFGEMRETHAGLPSSKPTRHNSALLAADGECCATWLTR